MKNLKTLTGIKFEDLADTLDRPLPPTAYKPIPGGANLTDIDAAWQRRAFNSIFGLYGIGWGFQFDPERLDVRNEPNKKGNMEALVRVIGNFWYVLTDGKGNQQKISYPVTGGNGSYQKESYAMKGAITSAISFGASMIGWQESVYMGVRDHNNTNASVPRAKQNLPEFPPENIPAPEKTEAPPEVEVLPAPKVETPPTPEAPMIKFYVCLDCLKTSTIEHGKIFTCPDCVSKNIKEVESMEAGIQEASVLAEERQKQSLAEKTGFNNMQYPVCVQCGWGEPINDVPPACPNCGVVASEAFTHGQNHEHFKQLKTNIETKLKAAKDKENKISGTKAALDALKKAYNNDRRSILQALSDHTGRKIKNYSDATPEEQLACAKSAGGNQQGGGQSAPTATVKRDKVEITREIYRLAGLLGLKIPKHIIAKIGELAGKQITSATNLDETELIAVLEKLEMEVKG